MKPRVLLDTGPLVAALDRRDQYHGWAYAQFQKLPLPFVTCEAVLTEAAYLLARAGAAPGSLFDLVGARAVSVRYEMEPDSAALQALLTRYRNVPMDLADACLVRMAAQGPGASILTLDSDFYIYRTESREALSVISAP